MSNLEQQKPTSKRQLKLLLQEKIPSNQMEVVKTKGKEKCFRLKELRK